MLRIGWDEDVGSLIRDDTWYLVELSNNYFRRDESKLLSDDTPNPKLQLSSIELFSFLIWFVVGDERRIILTRLHDTNVYAIKWQW